jgi:ABC-type multidrug transport system ATPase subunit
MRKPSLSTEAVKLDAPALAFENVSVKARSKTLVAEISGVVNKGEIMAVMGLSGSGKSTFLR